MSEFNQDEMRKFVFEIRDFEGGQYIAMRLWQREKNDWQPTHHGLLIPVKFAGELKKAIDSIVSKIEFELDEKKAESKPESTSNNHLKDIYRSFKTACQKVGMPDMRFHDLRHTAATLMVTGGIDLVTVKEILGHSKIEMTMRYAHPTLENKRKAVAVLESIFSKRPGTKQAQMENSIEVKKPLVC